MIDINSIEDLRREAYVTAIYAKMENDNVAGVFSDKSDSLLIGWGFIPIPIVGVDRHIFEYSDTYNLCDPLNSTLTYLKTEKCPLLFSSKFYIVDDYCEKFTYYLRENTKKDVIYENNLSSYLKFNYSGKFDEEIYKTALNKLKEIDSLFLKLEQKNISGNLLFKLKFYLKFVKNLDDRILFLNKILPNYKDLEGKRQIISASCPFAVSDVIDRKINTNFNYKIEKSKSPQYTYRNCIYKGQKYITYEEI